MTGNTENSAIITRMVCTRAGTLMLPTFHTANIVMAGYHYPAEVVDTVGVRNKTVP